MYVLIMFLSLSSWEAGGVSMQEFNTYESCISAKQQVLKQIEVPRRGSKITVKILTCVKK